jgi:hypothetical protein
MTKSSTREYCLGYAYVKRVDSAAGSELSCRMVEFYQIVKITRLLCSDNFKSQQRNLVLNS